jgi:hypothetical protein
MGPREMNGTPPRLPKMMIGFVVRRCTVELGHRPSPAEFAAWANREGDEHCVFGRPISEDEAGLILRHQARLVTARSASGEERWVDESELPPGLRREPGSNVIRFPGPRGGAAGASPLNRRRL